MMHFKNGRHVAAARTMAGLTQVELAQLAGVHVNGIKRLERMDALAHNFYSANTGPLLWRDGQSFQQYARRGTC